ncbi:MAG: methyltransferase [Hyphomicrobiales bacterium]|nr:methyltransferase [Hyphomicrobiales bacterium]
MTSARNDMIDRIWHGKDPFHAYPKDLYRTDYQGWTSNHQYLTRAIDELKPKTVVEIGVWKGGSVITMANRMRELGLDGVVVGIDTFLGSSEHWLFREWFDGIQFNNGYPALFHTFASNIFGRNLQDYVLPLPIDSTNAAVIFAHRGIEVDLLHIDAAHDYASVMADLHHWWPRLKPGGVLIGDDYYTNGVTWPEVRAAFKQFFNSEELENVDGKCWIKKEG